MEGVEARWASAGSAAASRREIAIMIRLFIAPLRDLASLLLHLRGCLRIR
jgi:hypothetical protein